MLLEKGYKILAESRSARNSKHQRFTMNYHSISTIIIAWTLIGLTGCSDSNFLGDESSNSGNIGKNLAQNTSSPPNSLDSTQIIIEAGVVDGAVDLEVIDQQEDLITLDAVSSDPTLLTNTISINTPYAPPSSDPTSISIPHQLYKHTPSSVTYNGSTRLYYQVNGSSQSKTLSSHEQDIMDWMQTFRTYANESGSGSTPIENSAAGGSAQQKANEINLKKMTDQQIKKWLKEKGYKVKKLGNRQFELTKVIGKNTSRKVYIHSLFDAETEEMTPLGITRNNKKLSKTLVKKVNNKRRHITKTEHSLFKKKAKKLFMKVTSKQ